MTPLLQQAAHAATASPTAGVFADSLRVLVVLALVSAAAFWGLRWLARRGGFGALASAAGDAPQVKVLARVALEPRKALYLVQVGERILLVGTGEGGPPSLLVELEPDRRVGGTAVRGEEEKSGQGQGHGQGHVRREEGGDG